MKKLLVLPAVLLIAGMMLTGCPSDPDEHIPLENPDFVLTADGENGAQYEYEITGLTLTKDKVYEAILAVTEIDEGLVAGHIAGQVAYKDSRTLEDGAEDWIEWKTVGKWANAEPNTITAGAKTYKWTFTVTESTPDSDNVKQVFQITAQDKDWSGSAFPEGTTFGVKGSITFREKAAVNYGTPQVITIDTSISGGDSESGKGNIQGDEFTKVENAAQGSILRFYITCTLNDNDDGPKPGWGIGSVGNLDEGNASITVPAGVEFGADKEFTVDVEVVAALAARANTTDNWLFVNIWNAKITKVELLEPAAE